MVLAACAWAPGVPGSTGASPEVRQEENTPCLQPRPDPDAKTHGSLTCQPLLGQPPSPGLPSMRPKGVLLT